MRFTSLRTVKGKTSTISALGSFDSGCCGLAISRMGTFSCALRISWQMPLPLVRKEAAFTTTRTAGHAESRARPALPVGTVSTVKPLRLSSGTKDGLSARFPSIQSMLAVNAGRSVCFNPAPPCGENFMVGVAGIIPQS